MPLVKGQSAPRRGWSLLCAQEGGERDPGKAGWAQEKQGLDSKGKETRMDSLYHWGIHDVRAPTIQVQPGERWTKWGGGVSDVYRGAGGRRSPSTGGPSRLWHGGRSARGWDPASVKSRTEGNHMFCLFLQGLDTSQACGGLAQEAGGPHRLQHTELQPGPQTMVPSTDRPFSGAMGIG